jgi:Spy/CpxP family protein refolding chaperone
MRNVMRVILVVGTVAASVSAGVARADAPAQQPAPPGAQQAAPRQPAPPGAAQQATPAQEKKATSESGDFVEMVEEALAGVNLRQDQTDTLQKLGADVDAKVGAADQAKRDYLSALADEIEAGKVDAGSLKSKTDAVADAASAASPDVRGALEKIHDTLDPEQRKAFVKGFHDALQKHAGRFDKKMMVDRWAKALNLTDEQKQKIGDIIGGDTVADDVARARIELVLAAFPGKHFKIDDLLAPESTERERVTNMMNHIAGITARVTDVLTPEQRKTAADRIRSKVSGRESEEGSETGKTSAHLEATDSTSEAIWMGGGVARAGFATGYRGFASGGFVGGYGVGYGGGWLF